MTLIPLPTSSPPTQEELQARIARVQEKITSGGYDCYISFDPVNIYYLTNFANYVHERPFILIIPSRGTPTMLAPVLELTHVKTKARCPLEYLTYYEFPAPEGENWQDIYPTVFPKDPIVGIEGALPSAIREATPGKTVIDDLIDDVRLIKTDYEIARTVHACNILNEAHRKLLEICRPEVLEVTIFSEVTALMMGRIITDMPDANYIVTKPLAGVAPPSTSHDPHFVLTPFIEMETGGPHVSGVGGQIDGYGAEIERSFFLDTVPDAARRPFEVMMEARGRAFELCVPGSVFSDIDREARRIICDAGFGDHILHRTGHGLGITGHEAPYIALGDDREVEPGMIVSIEPGIYIEGLGGFRHSDTVLITENGPVSLTKAPDRLEDLVLLD
ncbi:MAG: aminopeptidase P family protein [Deltaproteobacteria bacterium]|nr:aminopeptidase P family protein [Candidatus Zymogenaceae bacterium]